MSVSSFFQACKYWGLKSISYLLNTTVYFFNKINFLVDIFDIATIATIKKTSLRLLIAAEAELHMTSEQFWDLNERAYQALENAAVRQFIIDRHMTSEQFCTLYYNEYAYCAIEDHNIRQFIIDRHMTVEQLKKINFNTYKALLNNEIRQLIIDERMTVTQLCTLPEDAYQYLRDIQIRGFILNDHLTIEQLLVLDKRGYADLQNAIVAKYVTNQYMTIQEFYSLNSTMRQLLLDGYITVKQLSTLKQIRPFEHAYDSIHNNKVYQFIVDGHMTIEQFNRLSSTARQFIFDGHMTVEKLEGLPDYISQLIINEYMTIEQLCKNGFNSWGYKALNTPEVRQFIIDGHITSQQFFNFHRLTYYTALGDVNVREFILNEHMNIEQFCGLSEHACDALQDAQIRQFIIDGCISIEQFCNLKSDAYKTLKNSAVRQFIIDGHITSQQFCALNEINAHRTLENTDVRQFIVDGHMSIEQYGNLQFQHYIALEVPAIRQYIINGSMTVEHFCSLTEGSAAALKSDVVRQFIREGRVTIEQFSDFRSLSGASTALKHPWVQKFILDGHITIEQFCGLHDSDAYKILEKPQVIQFILDGHMTVEQFCRLNTLDRHADSRVIGPYQTLWNDEVRQLIIDGHMTAEQYCSLNQPLAYDAITQCLAVRQLIVVRRISTAQLRRINDIERYRAIINTNTAQRILAGELDVEDILGPEPQLRQEPINAYNEHQSTHTASVHKSVSASAAKLYTRYRELIATEKIDSIIQSFVQYLDSLQKVVEFTYNGRTRNCLPHAKKCIARIGHSTYDYIDAVSKVSTRQLLTMACLIILEKGQDSTDRFIQALYEIEREYNIAKPTNDKEETASRQMCAGGTFNKIVEGLAGIDPDCEIIFITPDSIGDKTKALVLEYVSQHITKTKNICDSFMALNDQCPNNLWQQIWASVKDAINNELTKEFCTGESENVANERLGHINVFINFFNDNDTISSKDINIIKSKVTKLQAANIPAHTLDVQAVQNPLLFSLAADNTHESIHSQPGAIDKENDSEEEECTYSLSRKNSLE